MKRFILLLTLLLLILLGVSKLTENLINNEITLKWIIISNLFYYFLTIILFSISLIGVQSKNNKIFVKTLGTGIILRLLFTLSFIAISLILNDIERIPFIIANILLYFIYMAFEIKFLAFNLRHDSEQGQNVENTNK
ncbi:MAG: hypothetical protein J5I91_02870 [Bacteroidetes bacterium]|nr:hypothetical protein [Bacteroidota bacterium]